MRKVKRTTKKTLDKAKKNKNDEFFTSRAVIESELKSYKQYFKNKVVFCNCNDGDDSEFYWYFKRQFQILGLKKLITLSYSINNNAKKYEITLSKNKSDLEEKIYDLGSSGNFKDNNSLELLKQSDIVVTNPPFSLFREYISILIEYKKDFLVIGPTNALSYQEIFPLIKDNKVRIGYTLPNEFITEKQKIDDGNFKSIKTKKFGNIYWYTTLNVSTHNEEFIFFKTYSKDKYSKYDNYDAININYYKDIPDNYYDEMGVPISFLKIINLNQFFITGHMSSTKKTNYNKAYPYVNKKKKFARVLIKRKHWDISNGN